LSDNDNPSESDGIRGEGYIMIAVFTEWMLWM